MCTMSQGCVLECVVSECNVDHHRIVFSVRCDKTLGSKTEDNQGCGLKERYKVLVKFACELSEHVVL